MSEVKRYAAGWDDEQERVTLTECAEGPLVKHPDYLSLQIVNVTRSQHIEAQQDTIATLRGENAAMKARAEQAEARCKRLGCLLTGRDREETADKIFAVAQGRMNTRSVWILADELMLAARAKEQP